MIKALGIVRPIDRLGRIVIPKDIRNNYNIKTKDKFEIFLDNKNQNIRIILEKHKIGCKYCGDIENLIEYHGEKICTNCIKEMNKKI